MKEYVIDAKNIDEKELNRTIKEQATHHNKLIINNPDSKHNICAGLNEDVDIKINGSVGYFVGTMVNGANIHVNGNAGWFVGDNMTKGELIIEGTAGDGVELGVLWSPHGEVQGNDAVATPWCDVEVVVIAGSVVDTTVPCVAAAAGMVAEFVCDLFVNDKVQVEDAVAAVDGGQV